MEEQHLIDRILLFRTTGKTWKEIGEILDMTPDAVRGRYRRWEEKQKEMSLQEIDDVIDKQVETFEFDDWKNSFERIVAIQDEYDERNYFTNKTYIHFDKKKVVIAITGDWHIGLKSVDYMRLKHDIDNWVSNDIFVVINGDIIENGIGTQGIGSATEQLISPELQHLVARDIVTTLSKNNNLILATQGNHGNRSGRVLFETIRYIYEQENIPVFGNKGVATITIGNKIYRMFVGHQMPGGTDSNPFGAHLKILKAYSDIDISTVAHVHTWNYASMYYQGKYVHMMTNGTYSVDEEYAVRYFNPIGGKINHYIGLSEDEIKHFESIEEALEWRDDDME